MSQLYIRVRTGFYTNRKTVKLRSKIGADANWIPPRLWAYAAENQPDGNLSSYTSEEIAELVGCPKYATSILQALTDCGFIEKNGMIHDWAEHNGYHERFSIRAKTAASARWSKVPPTPPEDTETGKGKGERGDKHCYKHATSIPTTPLKNHPPLENSTIQLLKTELGSLFKRNGRPWNYEEEFALSEICQSGTAAADLRKIIALRERMSLEDRHFFPRSVISILRNWNKLLDTDAIYQTPKTPDERKAIEAALNRWK